MNFLIYGANGYTGELITRFAAERGLRPLVAGRRESEMRRVAERFGLEYRVFSLEDSSALDAALQDVELVLHCAGPFSITSRPMLEACLRNQRHYLDITGEISVFEYCASLDKKARAAGIMIMPGVGFDVVPSDCLALHLKKRLPDATHLTLAFFGVGRLSHGTLATMIMNLGRGGAIRKDGRITPVPAAFKTREINFGTFRKVGVTIPWGDVSTAFYSTGIPNIEVFSVVPRSALKLMRTSRYFGRLLVFAPVQQFLQSRIPPGGPSDEERASGKSLLWGEVVNQAGNQAEARMETPEGYTLTALSALKICEKILAGDYSPGFQTPAKAFGADLILEIDGVSRKDP
ncbi:MAG: saccharopine dehydrogenase [Blastocatellia bacterium]